MASHPRVTLRGDAVIAGAGVLVCAVMGLMGQPDWWWSAAMAATLALRRTAPLPSAALAMTISAVHLVLDASLLMPGDVVLLVAVYSVAANASERARHAGMLLGAAFVAVLGGRTLLGRASSAPGAAGLVVGLVAVSLVAAWTVGLLERRKTDALQEAVHRRMLSERDADARTQLAAYEERERISDDMHDILAHTLTSVVVQAESGRAIAPDAEVADLFATISSSSRAALQEVRGLLAPTTEHATRPTPSLDDLHELIQTFTRSGLHVEMQHSGRPCPMSQGMSLAVYRVVQESLTNALRHGGDNKAHIHVGWAPDLLTVTVSNPVEGSSPNQSIREHRGLAGIRRRCTLYGGEAHYECADVFSVVATWPLALQKNVTTA